MSKLWKYVHRDFYAYAFQKWRAAVSLWGPQNHFNGNEDDLAAVFVGYLPGHSGPEKLLHIT